MVHESGQITTTSWRHGQKRTKVEKRVVFPIKTLTLEMSPIGMIQETRKKTEISDVVAAIVKKLYSFDVFSENHENSKAKIPADEKKKSQK